MEVAVPYFKIPSWYVSKRTEGGKNICQDTWGIGQHLNWILPKSKSVGSEVS
jgi:hypothetical protein